MASYKLRKAFPNPGGTPHYSLSVPAAIGNILEIAKQTRFTCELTEDGLLFKPQAAANLPSWLNPASGSNPEAD
jgi:hypothetical protein